MVGLYRVFVSDRVSGFRESECLEFRMLGFSGFDVKSSAFRGSDLGVVLSIQGFGFRMDGSPQAGIVVLDVSCFAGAVCRY